MIKWYTQQDLPNEIKEMIIDYKFHIDTFDTSCCPMYIGYVTEDNKIAGCLGISWDTIKYLRVKKEFRKRNIATALLKYAENLVKVYSNCSNVYVNENNTPAIYFFSKNGYDPIGYGEYYYVLKKNLDRSN